MGQINGVVSTGAKLLCMGSVVLKPVSTGLGGGSVGKGLASKLDELGLIPGTHMTKN